MPEPATPTPPSNFIHEIVEADLAAGKSGKRVATRFPPEPNGYLHIGHAKSICLNFGTANKYSGVCHLRMDDTNPAKEEQEYIDSIQRDVRWLGFDWGAHEYHASDYFDKLYEWAVVLIKHGKAFVCDLTADDVSKTRGTLTGPGRASPYRDRTVEENLDLFERMRKGEFPDGARTLRAKIDMASPNVNLRDPVMYRILHAEHPRTGGKWCIYPMYDWAHGQSDWLEGITHSVCTLEFEDHKPLYDWFIDQLIAAGVMPTTAYGTSGGRPRQYEFARLNVAYMMMSKRKLLDLVKENHVRGWDDPRMPTIAGLRRRGYSPEGLRLFCDTIGVTRFNGVTQFQLLEFCIRTDLNKRALRRMAVLRPVKLVIDNYPDGQSEEMDAVNNPEDAGAGTRKVPFSKTLYIEREDFEEVPPPKYFRLYPGNEVRLRYGYLVRCTGCVKNERGEVVEVHATYDPATRGGDAPDKRKIKATIHWLSAEHAVPAEVRLYDHLFTKEDPNDVADGQNWRANINPKSLEVVKAFVEPAAGAAKPGEYYQFERLGYFCLDADASEGKPVFNKTAGLRDSYKPGT